jgi:uncharacterized membrane protein HdeD (DUF308 family)
VATPADLGTTPLVVTAVVCGALGVFLVAAGVVALLGLRGVRFAVRTLLGLLLLSLGAMAGLVTAGRQRSGIIPKIQTTAGVSTACGSASTATSCASPGLAWATISRICCARWMLARPATSAITPWSRDLLATGRASEAPMAPRGRFR